MNNNTPCQKYCQDIEKMCEDGQMEYKEAYRLVREYLFKHEKILDRALELLQKMDGKYSQKIETNTEYGEITPEDFSGKEAVIL